MWKYYNLFFVRILCHWLCPLLFFVSVVWTLACYMKGWLNPLSIGLETVILSHSICITLPLVSLVLPPCWVIANHLALAKLVSSIKTIMMTMNWFWKCFYSFVFSGLYGTLRLPTTLLMTLWATQRSMNLLKQCLVRNCRTYCLASWWALGNFYHGQRTWFTLLDLLRK